MKVVIVLDPNMVQTHKSGRFSSARLGKGGGTIKAPPEMSLSFQDSCARWSYAPPDEYPRMVYQVQVMALGFQDYGSQMAPLEAFSIPIQLKNQS